MPLLIQQKLLHPLHLRAGPVSIPGSWIEALKREQNSITPNHSLRESFIYEVQQKECRKKFYIVFLFHHKIAVHLRDSSSYHFVPIFWMQSIALASWLPWYVFYASSISPDFSYADDHLRYVLSYIRSPLRFMSRSISTCTSIPLIISYSFPATYK